MHQLFLHDFQYASFDISNKAACFYLDVGLLLAAAVCTQLASFQSPSFSHAKAQDLEIFPLNTPSLLYFLLALVSAEGTLYNIQDIMPVIRVTLR